MLLNKYPLDDTFNFQFNKINETNLAEMMIVFYKTL